MQYKCILCTVWLLEKIVHGYKSSVIIVKNISFANDKCMIFFIFDLQYSYPFCSIFWGFLNSWHWPVKITTHESGLFFFYFLIVVVVVVVIVVIVVVVIVVVVVVVYVLLRTFSSHGQKRTTSSRPMLGTYVHPLSSEGSLSCHICCNTGPRFSRSHSKDYPSLHHGIVITSL